MRKVLPKSLKIRLFLSYLILGGTTLIVFFGGIIAWLRNGFSLSSGLVISLIGLFLLGGIVLASSFFAHWLAGPLENITIITKKLVSGDVATISAGPVDSQEIIVLVDALNKVVGRMQANMNELRSFVANASHELKTPLTIIRLRVEALRDGALEDRQITDKFLEEIENEMDRLSQMVNDLLDLSRIEAGIANSEREAVDFLLVVREVCESFNHRAELSGLSITCNVGTHELFVKGVDEQLRRLVYNLVDNAIKYSRPGGEVILDVSANPNANSALLTVSDTGFGIAQANISHIFERFYRVEATRPRYGSSRGSGLGLAIAKAIVESHNGNITVKSEIGKGSQFMVKLPLC